MVLNPVVALKYSSLTKVRASICYNETNSVGGLCRQMRIQLLCKAVQCTVQGQKCNFDTTPLRRINENKQSLYQTVSK